MVRWAWMIPLAGSLAVAVASSAWWRVRRKSDGDDPVRVANTERLTSLPRYQALARAHRRSLRAMAASAVVLVVATVMLAARPVRSQSVTPAIENRDIMLCLDVSGSMAEYNRSVVEQFTELVGGFDGERVGLTIFNSSAVTVFPLTSDYRFIVDEFERFRQTFAARGIDTLDGTLEGDGSSLVPDGIASCALGFPEDTAGRSRSMVVATDNEVEGPTLLEPAQVTSLVTERSIRVHAIFPLFEFEDPGRQEPAELREMARSSGGAFHRLEDTAGTARILADIERTDVARLDAEARLVEYAEPQRWIALAAAALCALLVLARRVQQ